jgi:hypothetical protein
VNIQFSERTRDIFKYLYINVNKPNSNKFKYFDFKLFIGSNNDIQSFEEGNLVILFSGKFTYRKSLN